MINSACFRNKSLYLCRKLKFLIAVVVANVYFEHVD